MRGCERRMKFFAETLWDLLSGRLSGMRGEKSAVADVVRPRSRRGALASGSSRQKHSGVKVVDQRSGKSVSAMQAKYDAVVRELLEIYGIRVRKWRKNSSGKAWLIRYRDGSEKRLLESPYPKGPMSCAIFLHEVGHHAIGFGTYSPRCLEEYHAWKWSLEMMEAKGLNITDSVRTRMQRSLKYAVDKAQRRGLKRVPEELVRFLNQ